MITLQDTHQLEAALIERKGTKRAKEITFQCPSHPDTNPSASYNTELKVWQCFACGAKGSASQLMELLELPREQATKNVPSSANKLSKQDKHWLQATRIYDYVDARGKLRYQVARFETEKGKTFSQRRLGIAGFDYKAPENSQRVLYRLPQTLVAKATGDVIYFCEGEKDVNTLESLGLTATCIAGGANSKWQTQYTETLSNCNIVVLEDNDAAGRSFSAKVIHELEAKALSLKLVQFRDMAESSDVTDFLEAGNSLIDLSMRVAKAKNFVKKSHYAMKDFLTMNNERPNWVIPNLIPQGLTILAGAPKQGKSFLALQMALAVATGTPLLGQQVPKGNVFFYDLENSVAGMQQRVLTLLENIEYNIDDINMELEFASPIFDQNGFKDLDAWVAKAAPSTPKLVVIDVLRRAFGGKLDSNNYDAVTMALGPLHRWAQQNGVAVVAVTHTRKGRGRDDVAMDDHFELISGSNAISSVADATLLLRRPRGMHKGTLAITGRLVGENMYSIDFDPDSLSWKLSDQQESLEVVSLPFRLKQIYQAIRDGHDTATALAQQLGLQRSSVSRDVGKLEENGLIERKVVGKQTFFNIAKQETLAMPKASPVVKHDSAKQASEAPVTQPTATASDPSPQPQESPKSPFSYASKDTLKAAVVPVATAAKVPEKKRSKLSRALLRRLNRSSK